MPDIRFIDSDYNTLFTIPDGGEIIVRYPDRESRWKCKHIDDYHFDINGHAWHICQFAERMKQNGAVYSPA